MTVKERFLPEDHAGQHATQTPHVQAVVIHLQTQHEEPLHRFTVSWTTNQTTAFPLPGSLPAAQVL